MCGIAGAVTGSALPQCRVEAALGAMRNRGPDGNGAAEHRLGTACATLLHTRLSILDLNARSDQPFQKHGLTLVYNGEVYNYLELKADLERIGARFATSGDTEVILEAYRHWGTDAFRRFEGMWALALFDPDSDRLVLSRDRFGEKPLYIWQTRDGLFFASEVKALAAMAGRAPDVNPAQIRRFLVNGYKSLYARRECFYDGVEEFPAASFAAVSADGDVRPRTYWTLEFRPQRMSLEEAVEGAREQVVRAVEYRLRSDVPVAVRLSGGIDSNVAAGIAQNVLGRNISAFSIVEDDPRYDETAAIMSAANFFGCPHTVVRIAKDGFLGRLERLVRYFDGPLMTISYYLHALVSEAMHDAGFKVSLGGTGADELFSGYYDHYLFWLATQRERPDFERLVDQWRESYGRFVRNPFLQNPEVFVERPYSRDHIFLGAERFAGFLRDPFDEPHSEHGYCGDILRNRMMNELFAETVPVMLHEDDLAAMAYSVENRAVYLDGGLTDFLWTVPTEHLVHEGLPKYLLRKIGEGIAAPEILRNPRKQGINAPIGDLVDLGDPDVRDYLLAASPLYDLVDRSRVEAFLNDPVTLNSESKFLFSLIAAKMFLDIADERKDPV